MIAEVLRRAEEYERLEQERIGRLVSRVENMRKTSFDGLSKCAVCGESIRSFAKSPLVCASCDKGVCNECGRSVRDETTAESVVVCKLCEEMRELWKKTGAWFYGRLPTYVKNQPLPFIRRSRNPSPADLPSLECENCVSSEDELDGSQFLHPARNDRFGSPSTLRKTLATGSDGNLHRTSALDRMSSASTGSLTRDISVKKKRKKRGLRKGVRSFEADETDSGMKSEVLSSGRESPHLDSLSPSEPSVLQMTNGGALSVPWTQQRRVSGWRDKLEVDRLQMFGQKKSLTPAPFVKKREKEEEEEGDEDVDVDELFKQVQAKKGIAREESELDFGAGSLFGSVHFGVQYDSNTKDLTVRITKCTGLKISGHQGLLNSFVKLHLLPGHLQSRELKTGVRTKNDSPVFNDRLVFAGVTEDDRDEKTLRLSLHHRSPISHQMQYIGETRLILKSLAKDKDESFVKLLEKIPLAPQDESPSQNDRGAIQVSLQYQTGRSRLVVGILQAVGLPPMDSNGLADPYVKCYLLPDQNKKTKQKTYVAKKTLNPEYNKEFYYNVERNELATRMLDLTVWDHDIARHNDFIGGVRLHSKGTGSSLFHWYNTLKHPDEQHVYWHRLSLTATT